MVDPDDLTLPSAMIAMFLGDFCVFSNAKLSFDEWMKRPSSSDNSRE